MTALRPVIIWDIDDVWHPWYSLAHQACLDFGIAKEGAAEPTTWTPYEEYGSDLETWVQALDSWTLDGRLHASTPHDDDLAMFAALYVIGADHHFVTARGFMGQHADLIRSLTKEWVDRHFGALYETLHFSRDKGAQVKELHATHAIDDNYGNWQAMTDAGARTFLMNQPWNADAPVDDYFRVHSITEFGDRIEKEIANS